MKGLLTSLQQTHARPRPACRMHASACLLILGSVCRTFRKAHGRYSSQKLMPRRGTANSSPGRSRIRSPTVGQEHAPLGVKHTLPQLTPQPTGLLSSPSATATELWRSVLNWSATMDHSHSAADTQHALRTGLFRRAAGEAVGDLQRRLARLLVRAVPLNDERLAHMRKIEIPVEFRGRPDLARFDASVVRRGRLDKMRLAAIPKIELQGFQKTGLVSFHRERVVGLALLDQVSRQFALGQQGIGTDIFPLNIDGIQQRDRRLDLVRAFDLFLGLPLYGQGTDFFWV